MSDNNEVTYNKAEQRYEMPFGNLVVYANVRKEKHTLYIDYVFAPSELRGKGAAGKFMRTLMDVVRMEKLKAVPICGNHAATTPDTISSSCLGDSREMCTTVRWESVPFCSPK